MSEANTMCGIFASADSIKMENLFNLNYKRGQKGFSQNGFSFFDESGLVWESRNDSLKFEIDPKFLSDYNICHVVAPTTGEVRFHPAVHEAQDHEPEGFTALWHNGILKESTIESLRKNEDDSTWDTQLMVDRLHYLSADEEMTDFLNTLDGSFACLLLKDSKLFVFRNALAPLFYDNMMNISSVKFSFSSPVPPGILFHVDFQANKFVDTGIHFRTVNNPYNI
jgi:glutamine phosphoribosylpyrophosphate amidotransferase